MKFVESVAIVAAMAVGVSVHAQSNPDYRVKADFRTPDNGAWGANESVGNAEFRVQSRFMQVYYGGVARTDEFKFDVQIDFTGISGYETNFASSPYNSNYDVYINDGFVGRAIMGQSEAGIAELAYDSRHPDPPVLPVPQNWPSPINPGSTVRVFFAAANMPLIGDHFPAGTPVLMSDLAERFARGDANTDGRVDQEDFAILAPNFDPSHLTGSHIGPASGDFTGDNFADMGDYNMLVQNWTASGNVPPAPAPCIGTPAGPQSDRTCRGGTASFSVTGVGSGSLSYQWYRNGLEISNAINSTARSATLVITNASPVNVGSYSCLVSTECGSTLSSSATLTICVADTDDGSGNGTCDGGVTVDDLLYYLDIFEQGLLRADVDGGNSNGVADGGVTIDDLLYYLQRFEAGC